MSGEAPNRISPRQLAVAMISELIDQAAVRILAHQVNGRDSSALYHSQVLVFLEQTRMELRLAARLLEEHPDPPPGGFD